MKVSELIAVLNEIDPNLDIEVKYFDNGSFGSYNNIPISRVSVELKLKNVAVLELLRFTQNYKPNNNMNVIWVKPSSGK